MFYHILKHNSKFNYEGQLNASLGNCEKCTLCMDTINSDLFDCCRLTGGYDLSNMSFSSMETSSFSTSAGHRISSKKVIVAISDIPAMALQAGIVDATQYNTQVK